MIIKEQWQPGKVLYRIKISHKKCCNIQEFRNIIRYFLADINQNLLIKQYTFSTDTGIINMLDTVNSNNL